MKFLGDEISKKIIQNISLLGSMLKKYAQNTESQGKRAFQMLKFYTCLLQSSKSHPTLNHLTLSSLKIAHFTPSLVKTK